MKLSHSVLAIALVAAGCGGKDSSTTNTSATSTATTPATSATASARATATATASTPAAATASAAPAGSTGTAGYRTETVKAANIKFDVPNDWKTEINGPVLVTKSPGVAVEFRVSSGANWKNDEKALITEVAKGLPGAKWSSTPPLKDVTQNGLKGYVGSGAGKKGTADVEFILAALGDTKGKNLSALAVYDKTITQATKDQLRHVIDSISIIGN